jgi:hypothetical protein
VQRGPLGEAVLEDRSQLGDGGGRDERRPQQGQAGPLGLGDEIRRGLEPAGDEQTGEVAREGETEGARAVFSAQAVEIPDLALAEDEDPSGLEVVMKPGKREAGLLDVGARDDSAQARTSPEQFQRKPERIGPALEQGRDCDPWRSVQYITFRWLDV